MTEDYHNLYWTRLFSVSGRSGQNFERYAISTDIISALDEIDSLSALISLDHRIHFDPRKFVKENPAPTKD